MNLKYFKKVCTHDCADKDIYLRYETSTSDNTTGNICVHCPDRERLNFFGVPNKFNSYDGGCARVRSPEMISVKENTNTKTIIDEEGHLLASVCGNTLPSDKPYRQLLDISIQPKVKRRQVYSSTNNINHIFFTCRNRYLCKNNNNLFIPSIHTWMNTEEYRKQMKRKI